MPISVPDPAAHADPADASPSGSVRQRRKDARPQELIDAALELFVEKGFAMTRIEEVATRAGVSKGTLYLYYASKEELLKAVIHERLSADIASGAEEVERFTGPTAELLRGLLTTWWQRVLGSPSSGVFKLVITEVRGFPDIAEFYAQEVVRPGTQLIGRVLQRGIDRGELRPVPLANAIHSLVLPMIMLCLHKHTLGACGASQPELNPQEFIHDHIELVLNGLLPAVPPAVPSQAAAGSRPQGAASPPPRKAARKAPSKAAPKTVRKTVRKAVIKPARKAGP